VLSLLTAAVHNNAVWCDAVGGAFGWETARQEHLWTNGTSGPPYYPNAVTLDPLGTDFQLSACDRCSTRRFAGRGRSRTLEGICDGRRGAVAIANRSDDGTGPVVGLDQRAPAGAVNGHDAAGHDELVVDLLRRHRVQREGRPRPVPYW
jgi:hypothetical protein